jgi:hypothetical protein
MNVKELSGIEIKALLYDLFIEKQKIDNSIRIFQEELKKRNEVKEESK